MIYEKMTIDDMAEFIDKSLDWYDGAEHEYNIACAELVGFHLSCWLCVKVGEVDYPTNECVDFFDLKSPTGRGRLHWKKLIKEKSEDLQNEVSDEKKIEKIRKELVEKQEQLRLDAEVEIAKIQKRIVNRKR
jgi:hypothetical protein